MFTRFLNNNDYKGLIDLNTLDQIVRSDYSKLEDAESNAEMSLIEHLSANYEIEKELSKGKYIVQYDRRITFPVGAYFYIDENIYKVIKSIAGYKKPSISEHWEEYINQLGLIEDITVTNYSQFGTFYPNDVVLYNGKYYFCLLENGYEFDNIRLPMIDCWEVVPSEDWQPVDYVLWDVVRYNDGFYALMSVDGFDNNIDPFESENWGLIGDYDPEHNTYDLSGHDYVVFDNKVFVPIMNVNSETPEESVNITKNDPRNQNIKKHLSRLAAYEISKLIAANNVSVVRVKDYDDSMDWLCKAGRLKINPQIPRKLDQAELPIMDWAVATFQTKMDPYENPWLT